MRQEAAGVLAARRIPVTVTGNVLPRIGELEPGPARAAIREVFLRHVIGGKRLSRGTRFASLVRAATPDAVLAGVELLADGTGAGVLVVDVGGATTDVYSALVPDAEAETGPRRDVAGTLWRSRTVEGDLGVGVGAPGVVVAAAAEKLPAPDIGGGRPYDAGTDRRLAATAAMIALRRHARGHSPGPGLPRTGGRDLRDVRLVVGSGGGAATRRWRRGPGRGPGRHRGRLGGTGGGAPHGRHPVRAGRGGPARRGPSGGRGQPAARSVIPAGGNGRTRRGGCDTPGHRDDG
nr:hypothetical protein GCM10020092_055960 [Actinoplanes digitatis]